MIDCDVESLGTSADEKILPLIVEVLREPFCGLQVLHHNVQRLHSKRVSSHNGFPAVLVKMLFYISLRPGSKLIILQSSFLVFRCYCLHLFIILENFTQLVISLDHVFVSLMVYLLNRLNYAKTLRTLVSS